MGRAVCEVTSARHPVPVHRVGIRDTFGESGTPKQLMEKYGLTAAEIVEAARAVLAVKPRR